MSFTSIARRIKCVTMEKQCHVQEIVYQSVSEVIREPAIVINGVPDLTPGFVTPVLDTTSSPESDVDPCFGEWLEGRKIQKFVGDQYHYGKVEKYDEEKNWYRVVYEDGNFEDMEWHELEEMLLPLDISIPLTTLALARCKLEKSVPKLAEGRNGYSNSSGRKKTLELIKISHVGEPQDELEANSSGRTHQGTLQLQNGLQREYTIASNMCNGKESYSDVIGKPTTVINGVPEVTPGCTATIMDNLEQGDGPFFGEWIEGRRIQKLFEDRYYLGKVEKYDKETKWYRVVYEDGDSEDLEWHELEKLLVPLDTSVPLATMALHMCKLEKSVSKPRIKLAEAGKRQTKCSGSMEKACLMEANARKRSHHGQNFNMQNELETESMGNMCHGNFNMQNELETESVETCLQMCSQGKSFAGEASTIAKNNQNGESMGKMLNMFQSPKRVHVSGDGLELTGAHGVNHSWKTARAEKQRRRENFFVHHSACHPK